MSLRDTNDAQGIDYSDGMEFGLYLECNDQNVFGFVRYVHKDSDVDKSYERNMADADQDMLVEQIQKHTGTYKKKSKKGPNGGSR